MKHSDSNKDNNCYLNNAIPNTFYKTLVSFTLLIKTIKSLIYWFKIWKPKFPSCSDNNFIKINSKY